MNRYEKIIEEADAFVLSTVDKNGFPLNVILSKILDRSGFATLLFYLNEQTKVMNNIKLNPRGTVSCAIHHSTYVETLNMNGTFTIESTWKVHGVSKPIQSIDENHLYEESVVVVFEAMYHEIEIVQRLI